MPVSVSVVPVAGTDLATLQRRFGEFAAGYPELPLYSAVCRRVADDAECAALLLAAAPGQDRPVLWLAALHDLVLRDPQVPAARWYASVAGRNHLPAGDPWPDVRQTVLDHQDELRSVIGSRTTQTNEVNRSLYLAPALALASTDVADWPVVLVEMGASAGLLLWIDRYRVELAGRTPLVLGDPASHVRCNGEDRSDDPLADRLVPLRLPEVAGRRGIDRQPVDLEDPAAVRWLEACLWPDVPGRVERFRGAVDLLAAAPTAVVRGDMVDDLTGVVDVTIESASGATHLVVFSSWALTYVDRERRPKVATSLADAAVNGRPVTWLTAEPPGCTPGVTPPPGRAQDRGQTTVIAARRWRAGSEQPPEVLGTSHPHGQWVAFGQVAS
jgi:hypothetical protein